MKSGYVTFRDSVQLKSLPISQSIKDNYLASSGGATKPLRVRFAATHSGKVTRNNGFYLPSEMRDAVGSWTAQYNKPILVHHNDEGEPIGRVVGAEYVDISQGIKTIYQKNKVQDALQIQDKVLQAFIAGLPFEDAFEVATKYLINDQELVDDPDYEGLGYIQLVVDISDPDAIQKILDGRYLTGSVGATTNKAVCSVCRKDWASSGACEHRPGKVYEKKKCVLIAGKLVYDEYSIVNKPADRHSRIIEIVNDVVRDMVTLETISNSDTLNGSTTDIILVVVDNETEESNNMELPSLAEILAVIRAVNGELNDKSDAELEALGNQILADKEFKNSLKAGTSINDAVKAALVKLTPVVEDKVKTFWGTDYELIVGTDSWGREYAEMIMDAIENESDPVIKQTLRDAKLSAEKRKSLGSSTFCGPDRSFPVPDKAHCIAARRLIGRYKGTGDKDKIRACIERKCERLGVESNTDTKDFSKFTTLNSLLLEYPTLSTCDMTAILGQNNYIQPSKTSMAKHVLRCLTCGNEYEKYQSQNMDNRSKFCSRQCIGKFNGTRQLIQKSGVLTNPHDGTKNANYKGGKIVKCARQACNEQFYLFPSRNQKYCSPECGHMEHGDKISNDKNPNWLGGISNKYGDQWEAISLMVRSMADGICEGCGEEVGVEELDAHHIVPFKATQCNSLNNLVALCKKCHTTADNIVRRIGLDEFVELIDKLLDGGMSVDDAHIIAASRLIVRHKGEGSEETILACVNRKAKRMGCDSESKKDSTDIGVYDLPYFDYLADQELIQLHNGTVASMKERSIVLNNVVVPQEDTTAEIVAKLTTTQDELKNAYADVTKLQDELNKANSEYRKAQENYLFMLSFINDASLEKDTFIGGLVDKSLDSVSKLIEDTLQKVDLKQIKDKLISSVETSRVEDPTLHSEDSLASTGNSVTDQVALENVRTRIMTEYTRLCKINRKYADAYLERMQETLKNNK